MDVFKVFTVEDVTDWLFLAITGYAYRYFEIPNITPIKFWSKMLHSNKDKTAWKAALFVAGLCFCTPISNATLERLFNHMNLVKTNIQNRLSNDSLNSILQIRLNGISMQTFHNVQFNKCVHYWYDTKNRRLQQKQNKTTQNKNVRPAKKREVNKKITF